MMKLGRNDPCHCHSGKKYKHCCMQHAGTGTPDPLTNEMAVGRAIQAAIEHHQAGRLEQAEAIYRETLVRAPGHPDALHLLGLIAHHTGRHTLAVDLIKQAIGAHPSSPVPYNNLGTVLQDQGELDEAVACFRRAIALDPGYAEAYNNLANTLGERGKGVEAIGNYRKALALKPDFAVAHFNLANALKTGGEIEPAVAAYRRALALRPDYAEAHSNLGLALEALGQSEQALASYRAALAHWPDLAEAHDNLGSLLQKTGHLAEAVASYGRALTLKPDFAEAHFNRANALREQGKLDDAIAGYRQALALKRDYAEAHFNLANVFKDRGEFAAAVASYRAALACRPDFAAAHGNLGLALQRQGKRDEAFASFRAALAFDPQSAEAHGGLGSALQEQGDLDAAISAYRQALALKPKSADTHYALALALQEQDELDEAADHHRRAIEFKPDFAEAHGNLGLVLQRQGKLDAAIDCYRQALAHKPDCAETHNNLGFPLQQQGRLEEAVASYRRALTIAPDYADAHSNLLLTMQYMHYSPQERFAEHLRFAARFEAPRTASWAAHENIPAPAKRLRVGYVSGDFRDHAVAYFIEPILANHDKAGFAVFCYHNHTRHDGVSSRIAACADHWLPCRRLSDDQLAERIRADGIDILIDLSGHTAYNRLPTFARKPAPIQMTWIGYPATTGLTAMDYRLTEEDLDPTGMTEQYHTETLLRLPGGATFQPAPESPPVSTLPALSSTQLSLASLNNIVKLNREVVRLWARILKALPHANLILGATADARTRQRMLDMFGREGVAAERLILFPRLSIGDYLALHQHIDLALDPFPYNGGTTSCHSLWMGVPFVTLAGNSTASRYGVALMRGLGLPEFVAASADEYVDRVVAFAGDLPGLDRIRQSLRGRITANLNRDPLRLTRHLEDAYRAAWQKWCATRAG